MQTCWLASLTLNYDFSGRSFLQRIGQHVQSPTGNATANLVQFCTVSSVTYG